MKEEKRILFGTDDSDFANEALSEMGELLKNCKNLRITLFHGAAELDCASYYESICQDLKAIKKFEEIQDLKNKNVLKRAEKILIESGIDQNIISTVLEKNCKNPSGFMLDLADKEEIDTIALARWGKQTVSRQVMGSTPYRISQMADNQTLWVIDHRLGSRDILLALVGASVSQREVEYTIRYFSHLKESKFTLFHVIPPVPPQFWEYADVLSSEDCLEKQEMIDTWQKNYADKVKKIVADAKNKLIKAGVPEKNVVFKIRPQKIGIARDIFMELESGNYGILIIGRRGYKNIKDFGLGSKANKLLIKCRGYIVCVVN
jgi:nucleotide-binding universal stress UspA family protein